MKTTSQMRRGFTLVELLVVIAIIATLAGVGVPALINKKKDGDRAATVMNAKQLGLALFSFDGDFGQFPSLDPDLLAELDLQLGTTDANYSNAGGSNEPLSQLLAAGYIDQESPFFAKGPNCSTKGDDNITTGNKLKAGENGFGYVMKSSTEGLSSSMNSGLPIAMAPNVVGSDGKQFDRDTYNKKAVVLKLDMSASTVGIRSDGTIAMFENTGTGTAWDESNITSPVFLAPAN